MKPSFIPKIPKFHKRFILLPVLSLAALPSTSFAQTWVGTLNGTTENWNVNGNWSAAFPNAIGASANLNVDFSANKLISLQQAITVGSLTLGDSSGTSTLGINSGTGTNALTFDTTSGNATLTSLGGSNTISTNLVLTDSVDLTTTSALSLSGTISGAGTLNKLSTGTSSLTLSGNNTTWTGGISHRVGTINLGGSANAVLGTGTFTFANPTGGAGNTLAFNAANSRTIANNFVNDNAAAVSGSQYAQISFSGGVTGNRVQTFTGTFSTGANYFTGANPQSLVLETQGSAATTADEGTIILQGSWAGYSAGSSAQAIRIGANSSSDGGTVLIDSAASIANSGGYQIQGNGTTVGTKLILNGAYTMANAVNFAGATGGARSSFGSRNASSTTATLSGNLTLSDADGANLFSQAAGAALVVSGAVTGSGPLEINRPYTYSTAGANTTENPSGTVVLSRATGNSYSGGTTITAGTLVVAGTLTGSGQIVINNAGILQFGDGTSVNGSADNAGTIFVNNTGTVQINKADGGTVANAIASNPSATTTLKGINASGTTNTFTATSYNNGGGFAVNSANAGATLAFSGASGAIDLKGTNLIVSGAGDTLLTNAGQGFYSSTTTSKVIKQGTGTMIFQGNQGFTGNMEIDAGSVRVDAAQTNSATYFIGNGTTTGTAASLLLGGGSAGLSGGVTFNRNVVINPGTGTNRTLGGTNTSGTNVYSGTVSLGGAFGENRSVNLTAATGGTAEFSNVISGAGQGITKTGNGTVKLTAANTYTGNTDVTSGSLVLGSGGSLASATALNLTASGSIFDIEGILGGSQSISSLLGVSGSTVKLGANTLISLGDADAAFSGELTGTGGSFTKSGSATTTLSGSNTYTGTTSITAGTLLLGAANVLPDTAALNLSSGAKLNTGGFSDSTGVLSQTSGIIDLGNSGSIFTFLNTGATWSGVLSIWNWSGNLTGGGTDRLLFTANTGLGGLPQDLSTVNFYSGSGTGLLEGGGARFVGGGTSGELVPVPEPAAILAGVLLLGTVGYRERRSSQRQRSAKSKSQG